MEALRIVLLVVFAAVFYGIAHDLVTAHLCVEYFTIGHPQVIDSESPLALALVWGVLATWWMGLLGGLLLAGIARVGRGPKRAAGDLVRPLLCCLLAMGAAALLAGIAGRLAGSNGFVHLVGSIAERVPAERHVAYLGNLWAHLAAYGTGALCLLVLAWRILSGRRSARFRHEEGL